MKLHFISMLLFLQLPSALATSFHAESIENFTSKSKHIVRGTVRRQQVEKVTSTDGTVTVYTYALVEVRETLKGDISRSEIRVRRLGGEAEGYHHEVPGSPEFKENEETVLFLGSEQEDGSYEIESMEMGKFGIRTENGSEFLTGGMLQYQGNPSVPNPKPVTLNELKGIIRKSPPVPNSGPVGRTTTPTPSNEVTPEETSTPLITDSPTSESTPGWRAALGILILVVLGFVLLRLRRKH